MIPTQEIQVIVAGGKGSAIGVMLRDILNGTRPWEQSAWFHSLLEEMDCDKHQFRRLQARLNHEERHSMGVGYAPDLAPDTIVIPSGMVNEGTSDFDSEGPQSSLGSELGSELKRKIEELDIQKVRDIWLCEAASEASGTSSAMTDLGRPGTSKNHKQE